MEEVFLRILKEKNLMGFFIMGKNMEVENYMIKMEI